MITSSYGITATERVLPRMALDFTSAVLDSRVTVTRALNTGTRTNSAGAIEVINADLPRFDYDPATLTCNGLLIEETRTNGVRNNVAAGAAAGTPGTDPTNWSRYTGLSGLSSSIVGTGTEKGVEYVDIRVNGTPSGTGQYQIFFDTSTGITAATGQAWALSAYLKVAAGSLTNTSVAFGLDENTSGGAYVTNKVGSNFSPSSTLQRAIFTATLTGGATVARIWPWLRLNLTSGQAIDVTLRIGLPQAENGSFATSVIKTSGSAVTRNADQVVMSGTNFSSWYNAVQGAIEAEALIPYAVPAAKFPRFVAICNGTDAEAIEMFVDGASGYVRNRVRVGGVNQMVGNGATLYVPGTARKACISYKQNDFAAADNGTLSFTDSAGNIPTVSLMNIGFDNTTNNYFLNGWMRRINFYTQRVTNNETVAVTK